MTVHRSEFRVHGLTMHSAFRSSAVSVQPTSLIPHPSSRGFTYLALLAAIVIIGIMLGATGKYWSAVMQRDREEELLFRGEQYVMAIRSYYQAGVRPGVQPHLTANIEDLLKDGRTGTMKRHLRKKFRDPMTGEEFVLLRQRGTRWIVGVRSRSDKEPFKKVNFPVRGIPELDAMYKSFEGKVKYSDWKFVFTPAAHPPVPGGPTPQAGQVPQVIEIIEDAGGQ